LPVILETESVTKSFGGLKAVNKVNIKVGAETITGLIGPNGSGKTTLFNVLGGAMKADSGIITFKGNRIDGLPCFRIYRSGLVRTFQVPRLFLQMTVLDNMIIAARDQIGDGLAGVFLHDRGWKRQEEDIIKKALEVLELVDLYHQRTNLTGNLSGGQMKLLELGRALMSDPKMLLLDEPAAGVSPIIVDKIFDRISELRKLLNLTFFIIEHRIETLFNYTDTVIVMYRGEVIAEGSGKQLIEDPKVIDVYLGEY
jgi:ABC-type branched-subunit amino acid transport system ATPase component